MKLLSHLLTKFIKNGRLTAIDHTGQTHVFGSGENGPDVTIRLTTKAIERAIFLNPELRAPEAYMDGTLVPENGSTIHDLLELFTVNRSGLATHPVQRALRQGWRAVRRLHQRNPIGLAARNVRHHYDVPLEFYRLWLDETLTYSCAYYTAPDQDLDAAQIAKLRLSPVTRAP